MIEGVDLSQHINTSYKHLVTTLCLGKETLEFKEISEALMDHYHQKQN